MTTRAGPSTVHSAHDALYVEEVKRTREFLRIGWIIAVGVVIALFIAPGDRRIAMALVVAMTAGVIGSVWMYEDLKDPSRYNPRRMNALALTCVLCGQLGIMYVGAFSAAPVMVALGLYFFCRTEQTRSAIAIYAIAAGAHGIEGILVVSGAVHDPGFYPIGSHASIQAQIAGQVIMQFGYALCFWLARVSRRTSLDSIKQLQTATRLAAQRDVQLTELRKDLDRALEVGGPGRFTGHVVGSWELGNLIGRGAMGEVYEATHTTSGADGAVKLLRREMLADSRHVERFFREVRVAGTINSPHVVRVLEASAPTDSLPFLAMERLHGQTLGDQLRKGGTLTGIALLELVTQIGGVLELARHAGIVHRDLKPHNLFRTIDGMWKVLDFGLAVLGDSSGTLTRGAVIGTPAYMSPEQAKGEAVDHRADLYAFGAVLYRCVTGRAPFAARDTPSLLYAVVHQMPLRPSAIVPISVAIEDVLHQTLAKDPDQRFATAADLVAAFTAAASGDTDELARYLRSTSRDRPWSEPGAADRGSSSKVVVARDANGKLAPPR